PGLGDRTERRDAILVGRFGAEHVDGRVELGVAVAVAGRCAVERREQRGVGRICVASIDSAHVAVSKSRWINSLLMIPCVSLVVSAVASMLAASSCVSTASVHACPFGVLAARMRTLPSQPSAFASAK